MIRIFLLTIVVTTLAVGGATTGMAQPAPLPIEVGAPFERISGVERTEEFVLYVERDGQRIPQALLTRTVEPVPGAETGLLRVIQRYSGGNLTNVDTSIVEARTLVPQTYVSHRGGGVERATFRPNAVLFTLVSTDGEEASETFPLDAPAFNAVTLDELVGALPLAADAAFAFTAVNPKQPAQRTTVTVVGEAVLDIAAEPVEAWVLDVRHGRLTSTQWVAKSNGRLLRQHTPLPDGSAFIKARVASAPDSLDLSSPPR